MRHALLVLALFAVTDARAIVRRHDRDDAAYRAAARGIEAVVDMNLPGGAGTLIAPEWVLTAAHVVQIIKLPHEVVVGGERVAIRRMIVYPGGRDGRDDIALVQLARPITSVKPLPLYEAADEQGKAIIIAGRGFSGDGQQGPVERERTTLRAGTNRIDKVTERWIVFRFDAPPDATELEAVSGPGDSGGPALLDAGGRWFVAGVSSGQDDRATKKEGVYGVTEYYARVSAFRDWIAATMSE